MVHVLHGLTVGPRLRPRRAEREDAVARRVERDHVGALWAQQQCACESEMPADARFVCGSCNVHFREQSTVLPILDCIRPEDYYEGF